jgi:hypothetical protein
MSRDEPLKSRVDEFVRGEFGVRCHLSKTSGSFLFDGYFYLLGLALNFIIFAHFFILTLLATLSKLLFCRGATPA